MLLRLAATNDAIFDAIADGVFLVFNDELGPQRPAAIAITQPGMNYVEYGKLEHAFNSITVEGRQCWN